MATNDELDRDNTAGMANEDNMMEETDRGNTDRLSDTDTDRDDQAAL